MCVCLFFFSSLAVIKHHSYINWLWDVCNILIINHVLRHLDDEMWIKPSATLEYRNCEVFCLLFNSNSSKCLKTVQRGEHPFCVFLSLECTTYFSWWKNAEFYWCHWQNKVNKNGIKWTRHSQCKIASFGKRKTKWREEALAQVTTNTPKNFAHKFQVWRKTY